MFKKVESAGDLTFTFTVPAKLKDDVSGEEIDVATELPLSLVSRADKLNIDLAKLSEEDVLKIANQVLASVFHNTFVEGWRRRNEKTLQSALAALLETSRVEKK